MVNLYETVYTLSNNAITSDLAWPLKVIPATARLPINKVSVITALSSMKTSYLLHTLIVSRHCCSRSDDVKCTCKFNLFLHNKAHFY